MNNKIIIAIDAMGGEKSPAKNIQGLSIFLKKNRNKKDFLFNLYGDENLINEQIKKYNISKDVVNIFHSTTVVSDSETPLTAIKNSKDSSMWNSINSQVESDSQITLSAGNTGVLFVISRMLLKTIENVSKPALAGLWPSRKGTTSVVLDLGANIECDDKNFIDFSEMGAALFKSLYPDENPRVALLNIGSEEIKGTENLKKAYVKLKEISTNGDFKFDGFIEGDKLTDGVSNVIVTDGFTGNIALKTAEGVAKFITDTLKIRLTESILSKFSIIFSYFALKKFKSNLDPRKFNGAIFLGLKGPVVKSHGSTDAIGFYYSIDLCYRIIKGDLMNKIKNNLSHINGKNL